MRPLITILEGLRMFKTVLVLGIIAWSIAIMIFTVRMMEEKSKHSHVEIVVIREDSLLTDISKKVNTIYPDFVEAKKGSVHD